MQPDSVEAAGTDRAAVPPPSASGKPVRQDTGIPLPVFVIGLLITGLLSAAGSYWYSVRTSAKLIQVVATPIALLDANQVIHATIVDNSVSGDRGAEGLARAKRIAERLTQDGYIVMDAQSVLSAPAQYYAPTLAVTAEVFGQHDAAK